MGGMRTSGILVAVFGSLLLALPAAAEPGPHARSEIDRLLRFIQESSCSFVRNGREYGGERAYRHVMRKFNYFMDRIETTEDFIELAATRSTQSGRPYQFVCNGESRESGEVLREALERLRAGTDP